MESVIFLPSLVVKKYSLFDPLGEKKQVRQHFLIPARFWPGEFSCDIVEWTGRSRRLALRL